MDNGYKPKQKLVAGLLALLFGMYGVHNFYLGYTTKGIIQVVGTVLSIILCFILIGYISLIGIWIWVLVEAIMIFTGGISVDANGHPLVD